jgi:hypothetical protein
MWIEAVEGPRKMKPSFSADSEVGSEDSNFARSARPSATGTRAAPSAAPSLTEIQISLPLERCSIQTGSEGLTPFGE